MSRATLGRVGLAVAVVLLFAAAGVERASAQPEHVELGPLEFAGLEIVVSFDLPPGYRVEPAESDLEGAASSSAVGPIEERPWGDEPIEVTMAAFATRGPESPAEAAHAHLDEMLLSVLAGLDFDEVAFPEEGELKVAGLQAHYLRVAGLVLPDPDMGMVQPVLVIALPVARGGYIFVDVVAVSDFYGPAVGWDYPEVRRDIFDAILSSLNVSMSPVEAPHPVTQEGAEGPVELLPISVEDVEYTYSLELPSGYTVVELGSDEDDGSLVTAVGPTLDIGEQDKLILTQLSFPFPESSSEDVLRWTMEFSTMLDWEAGSVFGDLGPALYDFSILEEGLVPLGPVEGYFVLAEPTWQDATGPVAGDPWLFLAVPADPRPKMVLMVGHVTYYYEQAGERYVYSDVRVGDRPASEVHRENLDLLLQSLQVSVVGTSPPTIVRSPNEISTDPDVIGSNIFLTVFVIVTLAFTSTLFNQTLDENRRVIEVWVGRFFAPFRRLSGLVERRDAAMGERLPWVKRITGPAVILALTGLIYGFLDPEFGFNTDGVVTFASLVVGVGAITYLYEGGQALFTRRRFRLGAGVKLYPVALAVAIVCVVISRLVGFQPGFIYGFVASYTLLTPAVLDRRQSGQTVFFPAIALLALSTVAWLLTIPLGDVTQGTDAWWTDLPEGAATAVFVIGLEALFFNMIPLTFMDGAKIAEWNRWLWLAIFGASGFLFWHVLLNEEGAYLDAVRETKSVAAIGLLAFYSIATVVAWAYFRGRAYGWSLRSLIPASREQAPGALSDPGDGVSVTTAEADSASDLESIPFSCAGCGAVISDDVSFCASCGTPVALRTAPVATAPSDATPYCSACGVVLPSGASFCGSCGVSAKTDSPPRCSACGAEPPLGAEFCGSCGVSMRGVTAEAAAMPEAVETCLHCSACSAELAEGAFYCGGCGAPIRTEARPRCSACDAESPLGAEFCGSCGASIAGALSEADATPEAVETCPHCPACGAELAEGASYCGGCGALSRAEAPPAITPNEYCSICGAAVPAGTPFCESCGIG